MGLLVKVAQNVEDRVSATRQQTERKLKLRLRNAKVEWLELKSRSKSSISAKTELRTRAAITRIDARLRHSAGQVIGKIILELERLRRGIVRAA
jgi:hypothetical protein